MTATNETDDGSSPIAAEDLRRLQQRSDARGLLRLAGHLGLMFGTGWLYAIAPPLLVLPAAVAYGFTLVTMFAAMHESIHATAFKTRWINDTVGWFAGLLSFYNSTFYRKYHWWHHRFTQLRGKDPELDDPRPTSLSTYALELSGAYWWSGKLKTYVAIVRGRVSDYPFIDEVARPSVVRSVRLQLATYGAAIALSVVAGHPWFLVYWLLPVAAAQPFLRAFLLAEHTGCSEDADAMTNTRTTWTIWPVRFLMWEMPYHAEHHRYPALPFFALAAAHASLEPRLTHVARSGYLGVHAELLRTLPKRPPPIERPV